MRAWNSLSVQLHGITKNFELPTARLLHDAERIPFVVKPFSDSNDASPTWKVAPGAACHPLVAFGRE